MIFPVRRCTFVIKYLFLLALATLVMFLLFQLNLSQRVVNDVMDVRAKDHDDAHVSLTSAMNHYVVPTKSLVTLQMMRTVSSLENDVNHHNFHYLLNPYNLCNTSNIFLMIYVHSSPTNFKKRMSIRETWGNQRLLNKIHSRIVFVLGKRANVDEMLGVKLEHNQYGDLVQEDFVDSYRNLSHKAICALKWIKGYCGHSEYVLKTDDDIFVNIYRLVHHIHSNLETNKKPATNLLLCNQWINMMVVRNEKSKWYLSKNEFPFDRFPKYCSGSAFLMSNDVALKMYDATLKTPFFWVDDYYITGMVFRNLGIKHTRFNEAYYISVHNPVDKFKNDTSTQTLVFFHTNKIRVLYQLWTLAQSERLPKRRL